MNTNIVLTSTELGELTRVLQGFPTGVQIQGTQLVLTSADGQRIEIAEKQGIWWMAAGGPLYTLIDRLLQELRREFTRANLLTTEVTRRDALLAAALSQILKLQAPRY